MVRLREIKEVNQEVIISKKPTAKIINCRISRGKLITKLDDEREISISVSVLTKWRILDENVKPEQLKNHEIRTKEGLFTFLILMKFYQPEKLLKDCLVVIRFLLEK